MALHIIVNVNPCKFFHETTVSIHYNLNMKCDGTFLLITECVSEKIKRTNSVVYSRIQRQSTE